MKLDVLNILLADDDESDCILFRDALLDLKVKCNVTMVKNGVELMEHLHGSNIKLPDLLFLDLNMPLKNGLQCLLEIRGNVKLKHLAVAIYSTSSNNKDIEETFIHGANIYLSKPNDFNVLKQLIGKAVSVVHLYRENILNRDNFLLKI